jgi:hypothetical protein
MTASKKQPQKKKKEAGRPSKYHIEYAKEAIKLCLLGLNNEELAEHFEVGLATIKRWMQEHPEFRAAIKKGRKVADGEVSEGLYLRAVGYSHQEEKIFQHEGKLIKTNTIKHYPPDTAAAFIWLKNRNPTIWRDKHEIETSGGSTPITIQINPTHTRDHDRNAIDSPDDETN